MELNSKQDKHNLNWTYPLNLYLGCFSWLVALVKPCISLPCSYSRCYLQKVGDFFPEEHSPRQGQLPNREAGEAVKSSRLPECSPKRSSLSLAIAGQLTSQCSRSRPSSRQRFHVGEVVGSIQFLYARRPTQCPDLSLANKDWYSLD